MAVDITILEEYCGGMLEIRNEIIIAFLDNYPEDLTALKTALVAFDRKTIKHLAHRMKSTTRMMGIASVPDILQRIEDGYEVLPESELVSLTNSVLAQSEEAITYYKSI